MLKLKLYATMALLYGSILVSTFGAGYFYNSHRTKIANMKIEIEAFGKAAEIEARLIATKAILKTERSKLEEMAREEPASPSKCLSPSRVRRLNKIR